MGRSRLCGAALPAQLGLGGAGLEEAAIQGRTRLPAAHMPTRCLHSWGGSKPIT